MVLINRCFLVNMPLLISFYYFKKQSILVIKSRNIVRFLIVPLVLEFLILKNYIYILNIFINLSNNFKNKVFYYKKIILSILKKFLLEAQFSFYSKLKLIGVDYKLFSTGFKNVILFKLGYSHSIYFKLKFKFMNLKNIKLFIINNFYNKLINISAKIRLLKLPEPYKGKGILFKNELLKLKKRS